MEKQRDIELRDRALKLLGVATIYDEEEVKRSFRRQMKLVNPHGPKRSEEAVPGHSNEEIARLLIQAYSLLMSRGTPTTLLEDDVLVGLLLGGDITPLSETTSREQWRADQFYDQFRHSIWPQPSAAASESARHKFKGCC